jgi:Protein of unknown function (DUF3892)
MAKQVTCVTKKEHHNPHERIVGIGGAQWWQKTTPFVMSRKTRTVITLASHGKSVRVIVASHNGRKYLKTQSDTYAPNNLLLLKDC